MNGYAQFNQEPGVSQLTYFFFRRFVAFFFVARFAFFLPFFFAAIGMSNDSFFPQACSGDRLGPPKT